jgi:hypothetical protein
MVVFFWQIGIRRSGGEKRNKAGQSDYLICRSRRDAANSVISLRLTIPVVTLLGLKEMVHSHQSLPREPTMESNLQSYRAVRSDRPTPTADLVPNVIHQHKLVLISQVHF